jgi:hypothetical protein
LGQNENGQGQVKELVRVQKVEGGHLRPDAHDPQGASTVGQSSRVTKAAAAAFGATNAKAVTSANDTTAAAACSDSIIVTNGLVHDQAGTLSHGLGFGNAALPAESAATAKITNLLTRISGIAHTVTLWIATHASVLEAATATTRRIRVATSHVQPRVCHPAAATAITTPRHPTSLGSTAHATG